jgi:hypothetical protein
VRFVLDPNVVVSAVVADGVSRRLLDAWRYNRRFELVVCPLLLDELEDVLRRERFRRFITPEERDVLMALLRTEAGTSRRAVQPSIAPPAVPPPSRTISTMLPASTRTRSGPNHTLHVAGAMNAWRQPHVPGRRRQRSGRGETPAYRPTSP